MPTSFRSNVIFLVTLQSFFIFTLYNTTNHNDQLKVCHFLFSNSQKALVRYDDEYG